MIYLISLSIVALIILLIAYNIYLKPWGKMYLQKLKYGKQMKYYYYPIVGHYNLMGNRLSNRPMDILFSDYIKDNDPKQPLKFYMTNMMDKVQYYVHDDIMQKEFMISKNTTEFYTYDVNLPLVDKLTGKGLVAQFGETHNLHRKILSSFFHYQSLSNYIPSIIQCSQQLIKDIREFHQKNPQGGFEVTKNFKNYTGNAITTLFLGEKFKDTKIHDTSISEFVCMTTYEVFGLGLTNKFAQLRGKILGHFDTDRTPYFLWSKAEKKVWEKLNPLRQVILNEFNRRIESFQQDSKAKRHDDLLAVYLKEYLSEENQKLSDKDPLKITLEIVLQQYITFLFAGTDTTACMLSTSLYFLAKYPEIQEKIRKECKENIPDVDNIDLSQIRKLTYLEAFFTEVLRHSGVVGLLFYKLAIKDHKLGDLEIKKGDQVTISIHGNHQNPLYFKDPSKFDVERWTGKHELPQNPFAFLSFSGGTKNCIGQHLSKIEAKVAMAQMLKSFRVEFKDGDQDLVMELIQLNQIRDQTIFRFVPL